MYIAMHLDVDQTPFAHGPFADENSANAKLADMINEFLADIHATGRDMPIDSATDQPASDVTVETLTECPSDLTSLPDVGYFRTDSDGARLFDRFFVVYVNP